MSVERAVWLRCDSCLEPSSMDSGGAGESTEAARRKAKRDGWHHTGRDRDVCSECWDEGDR